jgi:putative tricarboxylic transport membrane protein
MLGFVKGLVPGAGATIASFMSYAVEAQYGRRRKDMGKGLPEGIVAPQTGRDRVRGRGHGTSTYDGNPEQRRNRRLFLEPFC